MSYISPKVLSTVGQVHGALEEEHGEISVAVSFGGDIIIESKSKNRIVSTARHDVGESKTDRLIAIDLSDAIFHELQVQENMLYHEQILGDFRSDCSYYRDVLGNPPKQKLMRTYWRPGDRIHKLQQIIARGWDSSETIAATSDFRAMQHLFSQAVEEGNENRLVHAGPFYDPDTNEPVLVKVTAKMQEHLGEERLIFDLTKRSYELIVGEWRHAVKNCLPDYPPIF